MGGFGRQNIDGEAVKGSPPVRNVSGGRHRAAAILVVPWRRASVILFHGGGFPIAAAEDSRPQESLCECMYFKLCT